MWTNKSRQMNILALVTDAHGGFGGISQFNRDALEAMCDYDTVNEIHVFPRIAALPLGQLPKKLHYHLGGLGSRLSYAASTLRDGVRLGRLDVIVCGHINLLPAAIALSHMTRAPLILIVYGIEVWRSGRRTPKWILSKSVSAVISVSALTRDRFLNWCPISPERMFVWKTTVCEPKTLICASALVLAVE